jgi:hypothetical protein
MVSLIFLLIEIRKIYGCSLAHKRLLPRPLLRRCLLRCRRRICSGSASASAAAPAPAGAPAAATVPERSPHPLPPPRPLPCSRALAGACLSVNGPQPRQRDRAGGRSRVTAMPREGVRGLPRDRSQTLQKKPVSLFGTGTSYRRQPSAGMTSSHIRCRPTWPSIGPCPLAPRPIGR